MSGLSEGAAHLTRGERLLARRRLAPALSAFDAAVAAGVDPEATAQGRWMIHMLRGDFEAAWNVSDAVLARRLAEGRRCDNEPLHRQWLWDARDFSGKDVLIRCHHGLGDTIQFIRYAPLVRARARSLTVEAPSALLPLLAQVGGIDRLLPLHPEPSVAFEVALESTELPYAFRTRLAAIPPATPYWRVDPARVAAARQRMAARPAFRVGVAWAAGAWHPARSLGLDDVAHLLAALPDVAFVSLQRGPPLADAVRAGLPLHDVEQRSDDVVETAATILNLDLVISVDTMVAHLAGALGAPVWTLLHAEADWRWMVGRADSPWYPTMRLFRQRRTGPWQDVIERVCRALRGMADAGASRRRA